MSGIAEYLREEGKQWGKFLTFTLGTDYFAVDIAYITEINQMLSITPIPGTPAYMKGIVSLRGKVIPVIDMRLKLNKQQEQYTERTCIIMLDIDGSRTGLIVDSVSDVMNIEDQNVSDMPETVRSMKHYFQGIGKAGDNLVLILNCRQLLMEGGILDLAQIIP